MEKFIINNCTKSLHNIEVFKLVMKVIEQGKISKTGSTQHYCHATVFPSTQQPLEYVVYSRVTRKGSFVFSVYLQDHLNTFVSEIE